LRTIAPTTWCVVFVVAWGAVAPPAAVVVCFVVGHEEQ